MFELQPEQMAVKEAAARIPVFHQLLLCQPFDYISNMVSLETGHG